MTMPHLMNCDHSEEGWCLGCVKALWEEKRELEEECERLEGLIGNELMEKNDFPVPPDKPFDPEYFHD